MKITKSANGKARLTLTPQEWIAIGQQQGWLKEGHYNQDWWSQHQSDKNEMEGLMVQIEELQRSNPHDPRLVDLQQRYQSIKKKFLFPAQNGGQPRPAEQPVSPFSILQHNHQTGRAGR
jgi:hypothetical protein